VEKSVVLERAILQDKRDERNNGRVGVMKGQEG
jgi:hypothetical protein